jgi:large repetitive protein
VSPASLTFTTDNWNVAQTVTITGMDDTVADGAQPHTTAFGTLTSTDPNYAQLPVPMPVDAINRDNDQTPPE